IYKKNIILHYRMQDPRRRKITVCDRSKVHFKRRMPPQFFSLFLHPSHFLHFLTIDGSNAIN
ncbi:hypothetical protein L9F63_017878, partial [Diploptera punctata]